MENLVTQVLLIKINKKYHCKPKLAIFLRGFSLSSCPQHSLKVLVL
jgi:hypothetical protein